MIKDKYFFLKFKLCYLFFKNIGLVSSNDTLLNNYILILKYFEVTKMDLMIVSDLLEYIDINYRQPLFLVIILLFYCQRKGEISVGLDNDKLFSNLSKDLRTFSKNKLNLFFRYYAFGCYDSIIGFQYKQDFKPIVIDKIGRSRFVYFHRLYFYKRFYELKRNSFYRSQGVVDKSIKKKIDLIIEEIYSPSLRIRNKDSKMIKRDSDQIISIKKALFLNLFVISGGPGTGKTSLLTNIIRIMVRMGIDVSKILLGAPTGRAAKRMTESIHSSILSIRKLTEIDSKIMKINAITLHKIIYHNRYIENSKYGKNYYLPISVLILDEISMVDLVLMGNILNTLNVLKTKLILLGDIDQLPSVEPGSIFKEIYTDINYQYKINQNMVILSNSYRAKGRLANLSKMVKSGKNVDIALSNFKNALEMPIGEWAFIFSKGKDRFDDCIKKWIEYFYFKKDRIDFFGLIKKTKKKISNNSKINDDIEIKNNLKKLFIRMKTSIILTFVKKGRMGSTAVNKYISKYINSMVYSTYKINNIIFDGAILMITRNDYSKNLFNGDLGIVIGNKITNEYFAYFESKGQYYSYPIVTIANWDLAFAITIHKSQGSEFKNVMVLIPNNNNCKLLTKETLYTAVTRASNRVIIYGDIKIFNFALNKKKCDNYS